MTKRPHMGWYQEGACSLRIGVGRVMGQPLWEGRRLRWVEESWEHAMGLKHGVGQKRQQWVRWNTVMVLGDWQAGRDHGSLGTC